MLARSPALRASSLFAAIALTLAMLGAIDGLATVQHADPALAAAHGSAANQGRMPG